jgi:hypothetical protein
MGKVLPPGPRNGRAKQRRGKENAVVATKVAVVRKGCIRPRKPVKRPKIVDRLKPLSPRQQGLAAAVVKRTAKLAKRSSLDQCTWSTSSWGGLREVNHPTECCSNRHGDCKGLTAWVEESDSINKQADVAATIGRLRVYLAGVDAKAMRAFLGMHTNYAGYDLANDKGESKLRKGQHLYDYFLPSLKNTQTALQWTDTGIAYPKPRAASLRRVCSKWFFFATGLSTNTVYDAHLRTAIYSRKPYADARDLDVGIPAVRSSGNFADKPQPLLKSIVAFLVDMAEISEQLPHEDKGCRPVCVLPTRTIQATHRLYVHQMEGRLGLPWAAEQQDEISNEEQPALREEAAYKKLLAKAFRDDPDFDPGQRPPVHEFAPNPAQAPPDRRANALAESSTDCSEVEDPGDNERLRSKQPAAHRHGGMRLQGAQRKAAEKKLRRKLRADKRNLKYRYANKLCGPKRLDRPDQPTIAGYKHFCRVWAEDKELVHIICRAYLPFAKCDVCVRQRSKDGMKRTQAERDLDIAATADHLFQVRQEKVCYYMHRSKARQRPLTYLSMIIDGADQSKYDLPYFCERSHASDDAIRLKMHLYGVLVHGRRAYAFTCPDHEEQGHNATIQCIWQVIVEEYVRNDGGLPSVLFLQLDNTTRQNKGRFVLAFLKLLVEHGVFERIYVCFLPVGHTHEDIDQMFSRIAIALRGRNMLSRMEMTRVIRQAFKFEGTSAIVKHWESIGNIRDWLEQFITCPVGVMKYRHFRVARSENRKVMIQCRLKMRLDMEEDWRGIADNTHRTFFFKSQFGIPDLWLAVTNGDIPNARKRPTTADQIKDMRGTLAKLSLALPSFCDADKQDCESIVDLFEAPPIPFEWSKPAIKKLMGQGGGRSADAGASVAQQELRVSMQLGQEGAQLQVFYMVRPTTQWRGTCTSCLAIACPLTN